MHGSGKPFTLPTPKYPPRSGDSCFIVGTYTTTCGCGEHATLEPGLFFPNCGGCKKTVTWVLRKGDG